MAENLAAFEIVVADIPEDATLAERREASENIAADAIQALAREGYESWRNSLLARYRSPDKEYHNKRSIPWDRLPQAQRMAWMAAAAAIQDVICQALSGIAAESQAHQTTDETDTQPNIGE